MANETNIACDLADRHCKPCEGGMPALNSEQVADMLRQVPGWGYHNGQIEKTFHFHNFHETMAFVNAVAWVAHREDHHPDLEVGYGKCVVHYHTHAIGGLSENDFICAAKVEELLHP